MSRRIDSIKCIARDPELLAQYDAARAAVNGSADDALRALIELGIVLRQVETGPYPRMPDAPPKDRTSQLELLGAAPGMNRATMRQALALVKRFSHEQLESVRTRSSKLHSQITPANLRTKQQEEFAAGSSRVKTIFTPKKETRKENQC